MDSRISSPSVATADIKSRFDTHAVENQAALPVGFNAFAGDVVLRSAVEREASWAAAQCDLLGALAGDPDVQDAAHRANTHIPQLKTHDRFGNRIDWVEFDPSWHRLMELAYRHQVHSLAWTADAPQGHYARAALSYLWNQIEHGTGCPTGMAYAAYAGFRSEPCLRIWADKVVGTVYDFSRQEVASKRSVVVGYAMTEKQGGSDLRETQTTAAFAFSGSYHGARAHWYKLTGHKWFCSVPVADGFFTLARAEAGVTCFFLPRTLPDGSGNRFFIQRLKDKCGNRSNASSEVEYGGTLAIRVGDEGCGIREILSHAHLTRLDFAVGSAGLMRQALTLAIHHTTTRRAFKGRLVDQPMMTHVLADMAIEVEAATLLALRIARATDQLDTDTHERLLARIATPMAKYFNCSRAPAIAYESLQCHGGNGYVEEHAVPRIYREAPLNSIWEGTANMMCMDVLRAAQRNPGTVDAFIAEVSPVRGADRRFDAFVGRTEQLIRSACEDEFLARPATEAMARVLQGAELLRHSVREVSDAFIATRLGADGGDWGSMFGTSARGLSREAARRIVDRARVTAD